MFPSANSPLFSSKRHLGKTGIQISRMTCDLSSHWTDAGSDQFDNLVTDCISSGINCFDMGFDGRFWKHQVQKSQSSQTLSMERVCESYQKSQLSQETLLLFRLPALFQGKPIDLTFAEDLEQAISSLSWDPKIRLGLVLDFADQPHFMADEDLSPGQQKTPNWKLVSQSRDHWSGILGKLKQIAWPTFEILGIGSFFAQEFLPVIHWQSVDFVVAHQHFGWLGHHGSMAVEAFCGRHSIGIISDDYCYGGVISDRWVEHSSPEDSPSIAISSQDFQQIRQAGLLAQEYDTDLQGIALYHAMDNHVPASTIIKISGSDDLVSKIAQTQTHLPARPLAIIGRPISNLTADSFVP